MSATKSFRKILNNVGERVSPCLTPNRVSNQHENIWLTFTIALVLLYIALIAL